MPVRFGPSSSFGFPSHNVDLITIIERFGITTAVIVAGGLAFYKGFWPMMLKKDEEFRQMLMKLLADADRRSDRKDEDFLKALERRDNVLKDAVGLYEKMSRERAARRKTS